MESTEEEKREKLLQYGKRVWNITEGTDDERINSAIEKTVSFFESLGIKTRLSDYGIKDETIDRIVSRFETRKWIALGDRGLITPNVTRIALEYQK